MPFLATKLKAAKPQDKNSSEPIVYFFYTDKMLMIFTLWKNNSKESPLKHAFILHFPHFCINFPKYILNNIYFCTIFYMEAISFINSS